MKIKTVNYVHGGVALEIVGESDIDFMILKQVWQHGEMTRGNGSTVTPDGMRTGFYLHLEKKTTESKDGKS